MAAFKPFADDQSSLSISEFTVENGTDRLSFYGNLDLARDKIGLDRARTLRALFADIVTLLEADAALPDALPPPKPIPTTTVKNPFA